MYERDVNTNALTYKNSLRVPFMVDNIHINEHDQLVAGHPNAWALTLHDNNPSERLSPSEVVLLTEPKISELALPLEPPRQLFFMFRFYTETILLSNGELMSASTVGATYKNKLLVGALFDSGILVCKGFL